MSKVVSLDDARDDRDSGWMTVLEKCFTCGKRCVGTVHAKADIDALECGGCGAMDSRATDVWNFEVGEFEPRIAPVIPIRGS